MMKILPMHRVINILGSMTQREIYSFMQPQIEKYSDKDLESCIKDIKEGNYHGLEGFIAQLEKIGLTRDVMLEWLENEKFLREHRRKYHHDGD